MPVTRATLPPPTPPDPVPTLVAAGVAPDDAPAIGADLVRRYCEPHRRYHTLRHLAELLDVLHRAAPVGDPDAVALDLAAWFHDAVYDPATPGNEAASAELVRRVLSESDVDPRLTDRVAGLVLATADHEPPDGDVAAARFLDADLAILGASPERYRRYADDVRAEYAFVDDESWRAGRGAVLDDFLGRIRLFTTDGFHQRYDADARRNLRDERDRLRG